MRSVIRISQKNTYANYATVCRCLELLLSYLQVIAVSGSDVLQRHQTTYRANWQCICEYVSVWHCSRRWKRKPKWKRKGEGVSDTTTQRAQCKRPHLGGWTRAGPCGSQSHLHHLPAQRPAGHTFRRVRVCVCTPEPAQRISRARQDIESQMANRNGRQARTCTCMSSLPTSQLKLRTILHENGKYKIQNEIRNRNRNWKEKQMSWKSRGTCWLDATSITQTNRLRFPAGSLVSNSFRFPLHCGQPSQLFSPCSPSDLPWRQLNWWQPSPAKVH